MSSMSIFAGVLLFFSSSLVGIWLRKRSTRKASFYDDYYAYLQYVLEKVSYERMPIGEINASFRQGEKCEFREYYFGKKTSLPLSERELSEIGKYLASIGTTDAETQIVSLQSKCAELKRFTECYCDKMRKDGKLYFKLSVLFGIVAFIIIV